MKILIVCSTTFYNEIENIKEKLEHLSYKVEYPNCYDEPVTNEDNKKMSKEEYVNFFKEMYHESREKISSVDAILVLNFDKTKNNNTYKNYIGASTFLEMYEAFMQEKKIFIYNELPDSTYTLFDEIKGFNPIILNKNINKIKEYI